MKVITQKELKRLLHYDQRTGNFTWKKRGMDLFKSTRAMNAWNGRNAGNFAGGEFVGGGDKRYKQIRIFKKHHCSHRLAWLYCYGDWPEVIDHINGDGLDNRISNLRSVNRGENSRNMKLFKTNTSGLPGVCWSKREKKWKVSMCRNREVTHHGTFSNLKDAINARLAAQKGLDFHANHGRKQ